MMKSIMTKTLLAVALTTGLSVASTSASAFPIFSVDETPTGDKVANVVNADKIVGAYNESVTITGATTFQASLLWQAAQFVNVDLLLAQNTTVQLYGLFQGGGTFTTTGPSTTFTFDSSGTINRFDVFLGQGPLTSFSNPADGNSFYGKVDGGAADLLIGSGSVLFGNGTQTCSNSNNCGSYGVTLDFALTATGKDYFVSPDPFYKITIATGQFNGFATTVGSTSRVNGSQDVVFEASVPEPGSLALLGLGLFGMGLLRRKQA